MRKIKTCLFITLSLLTLSTFARPLAQRNCNPGDLTLTQGTVNVETHCEWIPNDDHDIQITLHSKDVTLIKGTCIYTPGGEGKSDDTIAFIWPHKAAHIEEWKIRNNIVTMTIRNDFSNDNMNILFYLNKPDAQYAKGNKLHCSFSPIK